MTSDQLEALKNQAAARWPVPAAKVEQLFAVMEAAIQEARDQALEDAARYCQTYNMAVVTRREKGPCAGYDPIEQGEGRAGTHAGHGYAAAIRAMKCNKGR